MRFVVFFLAVCSMAQTVTLVPVGGNDLRWYVSVRKGTPRQRIGLADLYSEATVPFRFRDDAKAYLEQSIRDAPLSREVSAGEVALPMCATVGTVIGGQVPGNWAKGFSYGASLGCVLWQVFHKRKVADVASLQTSINASIARLVPDDGVALDDSGTYVGVLVAQSAGGVRIQFELK